MVIVVKLSPTASRLGSLSRFVPSPSLLSSSSASAFKWAVAGWSFFITENLVLSENRSHIIDALGEDGYHYLYGTCSTTAVGSIVYGYLYKVKGVAPFRLVPLPWRVAGFTVQALGAMLASQTLPKAQIPLSYDADIAGGGGGGISSPVDTSTEVASTSTKSSRWKVRCPFDFTDSHSKTSSSNDSGYNESFSPHGLDRITRHPGLWSFGLMGVGQALTTTSLPQAVCLAMPFWVALVGGAHQDSRHRRGLGGTLTPQQDQVTSHVPCLALIHQHDFSASTLWKEFKGLNAAFALGAVGVWSVANARRGGSSAIRNSIGHFVRT